MASPTTPSSDVFYQEFGFSQDEFFREVGFTQEEFATLRGVSRQYAMRTITQFLKSDADISRLCRTLLAIGSDSSRATVERLKIFASQRLGVILETGTEVSLATVKIKPYTQLFNENKELWIWSSASPLEMEYPDYWEKLCTEFLNGKDRLLVYFVPRLEVANQLALRFETALYNRLYDTGNRRRKDEEGKDVAGFGATIFIIVTNLAVMTPYVVVTNPGSGSLRQEGTASSAWTLCDNAYALYELSGQFSNYLIQQVRAAGLGLASKPEDFFPWTGALDESESGVPMSNYRYLERKPFEVTHEGSVGLFDGTPIGTSYSDNVENEDVFQEFLDHPLKVYPIFISTYRKKAKDDRTRISQMKSKEKISSRYNHWRGSR